MSDNLKQQTKKGLYWKFAEQFANYGMNFIIGIVMARLLSPSDYGITALPAVFIAVAGVFANAGFSTAMIRKPNLTEHDLSTAFYYSTIVGIICYLLLFFASPWIADFYNTPVLEPLMRVTALSFIYGPLGTPQNIILQRRLDFKTPAKISVVCRIISGVIGIAMAFYGYGVWALTISYMFAGIVGLCINVYVVRWFPKTGWSKESFKYLWGFGNKLMASYLLSTLYENIVPVFVGKYYSPAQLGVFNRAEGYAKLPSQNVTGVIQSVTFPVLSKMQNEEDRLSYNYRRMLRVSAFIIFPIMMLLAALARPLIIVMITEKWEACIILLQLLCFAMMWYPIHAINLNLLQVKGRSDLFLRLEIIKKIIGIVILAITLPLGLVAICAGRIISSILSLMINTYYTGKLMQLGFIKQMKDLIHILILSFITFTVVIMLNELFIDSLYLQIIIGGIIGCLTYFIGAYLLKFQELIDVKYLFFRK